jgi:hypothetical protein
MPWLAAAPGGTMGTSSMASPPIPPSLDHLGGRPFSFYPPIVQVEHNEWLFCKATWSEIQVVNSQSGAELWIPRRFVGEVSRVDDPVLIVGLNRELELKSGIVIPCHRRVIQMPVAGSAVRPGSGESHTTGASPLGIRLEPSDRRMLKAILLAVSTLVVLYLLALSFIHVGELRQKNPVLVGRDLSYVSLNGHDDFVAVTQKIGAPATDNQQEIGTILYRALGYPQRRYTVILMGRDKNSMSYIGAMDQNWHPIHFVSPQTESLLRQLPVTLRFGK